MTVGNRVREICTLTNATFVSGQSNPADLPSRSCSPLQFTESNWWEGPVWLKGPSDSWPKLEVKPNESLVFSECRKGVNFNVNIDVIVNSKESKCYEKFSKFSKRAG